MLKIKPHTVLHAIKQENIDKLNAFVRQGLNLEKIKFPINQEYNYNYHTFLEEILYQGKNKLLDYYVSQGYNLNPQTDNDCPLIMKLINKRNEVLAITLINLGINIHEQYTFPRPMTPLATLTPLALAMYNNNQEVIKVLIQKGAKLEAGKFEFLLVNIEHNIIAPETLHTFLISSPDSLFTHYLIEHLDNLKKFKLDLKESIEFLENMELRKNFENHNTLAIIQTKKFKL